MKNYLVNFMNDFGYPDDAKNVLLSAYEKTYANQSYLDGFIKVSSAYEKDASMDFSAVINLSKVVAKDSGVDEYTIYLLTLILLSKSSIKHYQKAGVCFDIWKGNFFDLKYKMQECFLVKCTYGVFCPEWYYRFFAVTRFTFGRLQFETVLFGREYDKKGVKISANDTVIKFHIPRSGERLTPQSVEESCQQASDFFREKFNLSRIIFVCHSWLLYPENKKILAPTSNLYSFIERFDVIDVQDDFEYRDAWRLFDKDYNGNVDDLPQDTSFRRAYVERIKNKQPLGCAYGVWVYEN